MNLLNYYFSLIWILCLPLHSTSFLGPWKFILVKFFYFTSLYGKNKKNEEEI